MICTREKVLELAQAYARDIFKGDASGHDWWHTYRVLQLAWRLALAEGAELFPVELAALLHDVDDAKLSPETHDTQAHAVGFMKSVDMADDDIARVTHIIEQVSYRGGNTVLPDTLEGRCVQDADRLDAIGAIGIARAFAFGGTRGRPLWDPDAPPPNTGTVQHFYDKLLLLRDLMGTAAGRALAEERHRVMEAFLSEFYAEWEGKA